MTSPYFDPETSELNDHEHDWQRNGVVGRQDKYLIIEYVCSDRECDARFSDTEPIDSEEVGMIDSWPFDRDDERGEGY